MHIPDGYLGPSTCGVMYAVMMPLWMAATRVLKRTLKSRQVPLLGVGAAFSFVIMMFNIPIPGGSTGHAVGSVLVSILVGPWAAMVSVSVALTLQALLFGDGGVSALAANCFNMAVVMPFVGYWVYQWILGRGEASARRRWWAGFVAGYVGINMAALFTGFMFGIQPMLHTDAMGRPLYCPYGLPIALGAMMFEHLLLFGFVEGVATGMVLRLMEKQTPELLSQSGGVISIDKNQKTESVAL